MVVAVTGANGFIGRHIINELNRLNIDSVAIDRVFNDQATLGPKVRKMVMDLHADATGAFELMGCPDVLIHLAWGGLPNYKSDHHMDRELPAQCDFLKHMVESGLKSLVTTGTCFEYGMQSGCLSEDLPTRPGNPYGMAKDTLRQYLQELQKHHAFALVWGRLFYMYGAGQSKSSIYSLLQSAVARGDKEFPMSGGEQLRDYLPVEDVAKSIVALARSQSDSGVVNICSGEPITVRCLVERWLGEHHWSIQLDLGRFPYPDYEPMSFWGDRSKLNRLMETHSCQL